MVPTNLKAISRVDETYGQLLDLAHRLGPLAKMPTVRTLREEMNVSQATLDAALARLEGQNILVRRQGSGVYVSLRLKQRNIILLCEPEYLLHYGVSPFWGLLVDQIRQIASSNEAHLTLHFLRPHGDGISQSANDPELIPAVLREELANKAVHGVITIGVLHSIAKWIEALDVPVVAYAGAAEYIISHSSGTLIQMGIAELARQDCKRIIPWLLSSAEAPGFSSNNATYRGAILAHGLVPLLSPTMALKENPLEGNRVIRSFHYAMKIFGPESPLEHRPDGILCTDDTEAQGVLMAFYRLGIRPGIDIKVATHVNAGSPTLLAWQNEIIRLEYDLSTLVQLLFETLDALMNEEVPHWATSAVRTPEWMYVLEPTLIVPERIS